MHRLLLKDEALQCLSLLEHTHSDKLLTIQELCLSRIIEREREEEKKRALPYLLMEEESILKKIRGHVNFFFLSLSLSLDARVAIKEKRSSSYYTRESES